MENLRALLAEFIPIGVLILYLLWDRRQRKGRRERPPIEEKLLRPAGYGLRNKIEKLQDHINTKLLFAAACSMSFALFLSLGNVPAIIPFLIVLAAAAGVSVGMAIGPIEKLRSYRLGLLGEQAVGEQLQSLAIQGYRIFHDVPGNAHWNIDHVAVGPGGVFAIETKGYSKRPSLNELKEHEADFDGTVIRFPWRNEREAVEQSRAGAKWLANDFLSKAVGERVTAQPIVALPGWFVMLKADSDVKVLSGKQVPGYIGSMPEILSSKLIQQIAYQLEQRCRTVEL